MPHSNEEEQKESFSLVMRKFSVASQKTCLYSFPIPQHTSAPRMKDTMSFLYVSRDVAICPSSNVLNKYSSKGIAAGFPDQKGRCIGLESIKPATPSLPSLDFYP
jgi:hypothetical protein